MARILVEQATGFDMNDVDVQPPLYRLPEYGRHLFLDCTDRPVPTITNRPVVVVVLPEEGDVPPEPLALHFSGTPEWSAGDITDRPCPTITIGAGSVNSLHFQLNDGAGQVGPETGADLQVRGAVGGPTPFTAVASRVLTAEPEKPPYRVPSMAEIAALPWNGYTVASTFSGAGGSSLGYRMAGYRVLWANEFVEAARDTYKANAAEGTIVDGRDIRTVQAADLLSDLKMAPGDLDILDGSPPCSSFSTAGKREKGWGQVDDYSDTKQRTDDLFFDFIRLLAGVQPKVFVAENVSGLVKGSAKGYFKDIIKAMKASGYQVGARLLDAQWLGVPQARQRLIFVGVRSDLGLPPAYPVPLPYRYSVRDALPWITAQGDNGGIAAVMHPTERRKFTIGELRRICAFPDDFQLTGSYSQRWERLGRAVPPVMMAAVATAVRDNVLDRQ